MDQPITIYLGEDRIISAEGFTTQECVDSILDNRLGVKPCFDPKLSPHPFPAARIDWQKLRLPTDAPRVETILHEAIQSVLEAAHIDPRNVGFILASTKGNIEELSHETKPQDNCFLTQTALHVAQRLGFKHHPIVISNACISGIDALIVARRMMLEGRYTEVIVAGVDLLSEFIVSGFQSFKSVSETVCRPYDAARNGLSLGEACGVVLLTTDFQKAKGTPVCLAGGAMSQDANHLSAPSRTGAELAHAMRLALSEAGLTPNDIDFVNAHGTATAYNDEMESKAIALAGLNAKPLNSLKPYIGHTLGASGVVETILSAEELRRDIVFATPGYTTCGVPSPVNVSASHRPLPLKAMLKSGSGFGGCNAAIVLTTEASNKDLLHEEQAYHETARFEMKGCGDFAQRIRQEYKALHDANMRFFKMDDLAKAGYVACENLLRNNPVVEKYGAFRVAIVLANHAASLHTDLRHQQIVEQHDPTGASPAVFVYTLPNIVAGEISIRHGIKGETLFLVSEDKEELQAEKYAAYLIRTHKADAAIAGWCDVLNENYDVTLKLIEKK